MPSVVPLNSLEEFQNNVLYTTGTNEYFIVNFWAAGPRVDYIRSAYARSAQTIPSNLKLFSVNVDAHPEIAEDNHIHLQHGDAPKFLFFLDGRKADEFPGWDSNNYDEVPLEDWIKTVARKC